MVTLFNAVRDQRRHCRVYAGQNTKEDQAQGSVLIIRCKLREGSGTT